MIAPSEEEFQVEAELLMEKELEMLDIPASVKVEEKRLEFEKEKKKVKFLMKKVKLEGGAAFHEKSEKNKKVNLGGPGKRNPRKTKPTNRGVERTRAAKRKKK